MVEFPLPQLPANTNVILLDIFLIAVTLLVAYVATRVTNRIIRQAAISRKLKPKAAGFFRALITAVIYVVAIFGILSAFVISAEIVVTVVIGIIIGIVVSARDILGNLAAYYALLASHAPNKGDVVEIDGMKGRLSNRSHLFTEIETEDGKLVQVPNHVFLQKISSSHTAESLAKVVLTVRIDGSADISKTEALLSRLISNYKEITKPPHPVLFVSDVRKDFTEFTVQVYVTNPNKVNFVAGDLRKKIREAVDEARIRLY